MRDQLPSTVEQNPELDQWLAVRLDGRITINTGKVEIGQGIKTALALIAAEELDVPVECIDVQTAATGVTPDEGVTAGSLSVEASGGALRIATASARALLLQKAAVALDVPVDSLRVDDGTVSSTLSNATTDYRSLQGGKPFEYTMTTLPQVKAVGDYRRIGKPVTRLDLPAKLRGQAVFVHDLRLPAMRHARVVRPSMPGSKLVGVRLEVVEALGSVRVIRRGSFLAVTAEDEALAVTGAERLSAGCRWDSPAMSTTEQQHDQLRQRVEQRFLIVDGTPARGKFDEPAEPENASRTLTATYSRPYQMHGSLGPSAAAARYSNGGLEVWTHSQAVEALRRCLADVLELDIERIEVMHGEGAGCYGHNGADDAAVDAALIALESPGVPVLLQWTRADEHRYEPYAPAMLVDMQASLDASGRIIDWRHCVTSFSHGGRPAPRAGSSALLAAWYLDPPIAPSPRLANLAPESGSHRNAEPIYTFPQKHVVKQFAGAGALRGSSVRSLGGFTNVFAIESFIDELARGEGVDGFEFRLRHLKDERAKAVLERLRAELAEPVAAPMHGRGIALARYKNRQTCAALAVDVVVEETGSIRLSDVCIVADAGQIIDADGAVNQLEGAFIQAASWTLNEMVVFDESGIQSTDWDSYPILRFDQIPDIRTVLIERQWDSTLGVGEAMTGPTPAAIANAVHDAIGVRLRDIPFFPDRVLRAAARD